MFHHASPVLVIIAIAVSALVTGSAGGQTVCDPTGLGCGATTSGAVGGRSLDGIQRARPGDLHRAANQRRVQPGAMPPVPCEPKVVVRDRHVIRTVPNC